MTKNYPGSVLVRGYADDIEKEIKIGRACGTADLGFPDLTPIKPLDPNNLCLQTFICLLMAYRFICLMCFIPKKSFMFNFSKTDAHICFTEHVLSIYCVKCIICDVTSRKVLCRKVLYCDTNEKSTFFQWAQVQNIFI